jgi:hypothetical protein
MQESLGKKKHLQQAFPFHVCFFSRRIAFFFAETSMGVSVVN